MLGQPQKKPYIPGSKPHYSNDRTRPSTSASSSRPRTAVSASEAKKERRTDDALDLSNTILTAPPALAHLTNLHKLDLSNCGLTSLAFVKEAKATLTWLNVSGNPLNGEGAWDGVEQLGRLFGESRELWRAKGRAYSLSSVQSSTPATVD